MILNVLSDKVILIPVFILVFTIIITLVFSKKKKDYSQIFELDKEREKRDWQTTFYPLVERFTKNNLYKELIRKSGVDTSPEKVLVEQTTLPIILLASVSFISFLIKAKMMIYLGFVLALVLVIAPIQNLKKKSRIRTENIRKEAPNFVLTVRLLLRGQKTPVQALKLACDYGTGDGMNAYTSQLNADLDVMTPEDALTKFAKATEVIELMEFAALFSQYIRLGATKDGEDILRQLENTFREMDAKMLEREKEIRPRNLRMVNYVIGVNAIAFIMTAVILYLKELLGA